MSEYTKVVQYLFKIRGTEFAVSLNGHSHDGTPKLTVEETRKHGDGKARAYGEVYSDLWGWKFECGGRTFDDYCDVPADEILRFLNEHPSPADGWE